MPGTVGSIMAPTGLGILDTVATDLDGTAMEGGLGGDRHGLAEHSAVDALTSDGLLQATHLLDSSVMVALVVWYLL